MPRKTEISGRYADRLAKLAKASARSSKPVAQAAADKPRPATAPKSGIVDVWFDPNTSSYFAPTNGGEYQRWQKDELNLLLRSSGYRQEFKHEDGLSFLERERLRITQDQSVNYAGPLGGYRPGLHEVLTARVLVTRGPKLIEPADGRWGTLRDFLGQLLGDQARYFCAWVKVAVASLRRGTPPWAPGQLLAVAGPPGAGKSTLQSLITPLLGGRVSSPWDYLAGKTNFNSHIYAAEHGLIGDVNPEISPRARRAFGASIKKLVAEPVHDVHGKGRPAITLTPFLRISLTLNDEPNSLHVLPPLDSDVAGKILLLRSEAVDFEKLTRKFRDWHAYYAQLVKELPAFLFYLRRWAIPATIADQRYGVVSFKDVDLVERVQAISQEENFLETLDVYLFDELGGDNWQGSASALLQKLSANMKPTLLAQVCRDAAHAGIILTVLSKTHPERVTMHMHGQKKKTYLIRKEAYS